MYKHTSEDSFLSDISSGLVFVDFWADWCGPCKAMAPQYDALSQTHTTASFLKLDIMLAQKTAKHHNVRNIPTVIAFRDGVEVARHIGAENLNEFVTLELHKYES